MEITYIRLGQLGLGYFKKSTPLPWGGGNFHSLPFPYIVLLALSILHWSLRSLTAKGSDWFEMYFIFKI